MSSDLEVHVTEPTKWNDTINSYISYKIVSKTTRSNFEPGEKVVTRRYTDFVWLCDDLSRLYPGVIIPTLPEKQTVGRFSPEFVEARRRALEKFLERIADHPTLGGSTSFARFLQAIDSQLAEAKEITKSSKASVAERAKSWFHVTANSLSAATGKGKPEEKTAADVRVEEISAYIVVLEKQLETLYKHSESMVKRSGQSATALFDFSQGLGALGQTEGEALGRAIAEVGAALEKFSFEATQHAEHELRELEEPLEEYVRYAASVKAAVARRQEKRQQLKAAAVDLDLKKVAFNKVMGVPGKEKDAVAKQEAVEKAQTLLQQVRADHEAQSEQLVQEFAAFKQQKAEDLRNILLRFAQLQVAFNEKSARLWSSVTPALLALDGGPRGPVIAHSVDEPSGINSAPEEQFVNPSVTSTPLSKASSSAPSAAAPAASPAPTPAPAPVSAPAPQPHVAQDQATHPFGDAPTATEYEEI